MPTTQMRVKNSFIPWSFPELVAQEEGIFRRKGLDVSFYTLDPAAIEPSNKIQWYSGLVEEGKVDAYSCCAWAALDRLSEGGRKKIVGATSSLNYAFSVFVPPDSAVNTASDLVDVPIEVNLKTGSHYCNLRQLEEHIPYERINLVHGGAPHNRLLALMEGKSRAGSLISPYTEVAQKLGFRRVFETQMVDVLAFIARSDLPEEKVTAFLESINEAIRMVNSNPGKFKPLYLRILRQTFSGYPEKARQQADGAARSVEAAIPVVQWSELKPYARETFDTIERWMAGHNLLEKQITYEQLVNNSPIQKVLSE